MSGADLIAASRFAHALPVLAAADAADGNRGSTVDLAARPGAPGGACFRSAPSAVALGPPRGRSGRRRRAGSACGGCRHRGVRRHSCRPGRGQCRAQWRTADHIRTGDRDCRGRTDGRRRRCHRPAELRPSRLSGSSLPALGPSAWAGLSRPVAPAQAAAGSAQTAGRDTDNAWHSRS
jgi:hypothetical protein